MMIISEHIISFHNSKFLYIGCSTQMEEIISTV